MTDTQAIIVVTFDFKGTRVRCFVSGSTDYQMQGCGNTMPDLSDWYIFIQDKLKICINLSLDKYKCMKLIQFCTLYFIF